MRKDSLFKTCSDMRLTIAFLLMPVLNVSAAGYAQVM
jgi:hypothetical protein